MPFPSPGDLPDPGLNTGLPHCKQTLNLWGIREAPSKDSGSDGIPAELFKILKDDDVKHRVKQKKIEYSTNFAVQQLLIHFFKF